MDWLFARRLQSFVVLAAVASLVLNLALLMPAPYMIEVFDSVFTSGGVETLMMLSAITLLFLVLSWFVDSVRARSLALAGRSLDPLLFLQAVCSTLEHAAGGTGRVDADALRDIAQLRGLLACPGVLELFDAPWLLDTHTAELGSLRQPFALLARLVGDMDKAKMVASAE
jgi:ABC-type protease/lipase transport system fused ATPase/permease subunit